ncbi:zeta toxin family protein [Patescibacteria group bacterium]|nr:zeta toxin family protein [Patescibacteria group bacterium]
MTNEELHTRARDYAHKHKKRIAKEITDLFPSESDPVSVFMAGSPGAGKTEVSKELVQEVAGDNQQVLRIDTDDLRHMFEGYTGDNSHIFQLPSSILAEKIHDFALQRRQSFIFDGTFSNLEKAEINIQRSLKRHRYIKILYVYQQPEKAWFFAKSRELIEGRKIKKGDFINKYFGSREVVNAIKKKYGPGVEVDVLVKDFDGKDKLYFRNVDLIDNYVPEKYTQDDLEKKL